MDIATIASGITIVAFVYVIFFGQKTVAEILSLSSGIFRRKGRAHEVLFKISSRLTTLSMSSDEKTCALGGFDKHLHLFNLKKRKDRILKLHSDTLRHIVTVPKTNEFLSSGDDGCIYAVDPVLTKKKLVGKHDAPIYILYYQSPSGCVLAGDKNGNINSWNLDQSPWQKIDESSNPGGPPPKVIAKYRGGPVFAICGRQDYSVVYFSGVGGAIFSLSFSTGETTEIANLGHTVFCLAFDDISKTLFAGCSNGKIYCISTITTAISTFEGHTDAIRWLSLNYNQRQLFSSSKDKTIRLWDLEKPYRSVVGSHADYVYQIAISSGGSQLYSVGGDGEFILWHI